MDQNAYRTPFTRTCHKLAEIVNPKLFDKPTYVQLFMKKYLLWKNELEQAAINHSTPEPDVATASLPIPTSPYLTLPTVNGDVVDNITSEHWQSLNPAFASTATSLMCSPMLLERLGPHILRSHTATANFKSIPHNEPVDLSGFRSKDPQEWGLDDVIAWMMSVALKYSIPVEELNMHRFACTGVMLMLMSQQNFVERDPQYGYLLHAEFRKLIGEESSFVDDWIRGCAEGGPSTCTTGPSTSSHLGRDMPEAGHSKESPIRPPSSLDSLNPGCSNRPPDISRIHNNKSVINKPNKNQQKMTETVVRATNSLIKHKEIVGERGEGDASDTPGPSSVPVASNLLCMKYKRNKDGKPRKRSQHSKGNKLWEFIRDALKDPSTCPSVVRWEDPKEGVFRIVESESLARLWGEKKNNQKMTYEKLSRAMRTYYDKYILVPVPKTGLYPKKLVYKFGPNASGWQEGAPDSSPLVPVVQLKTEQADEFVRNSDDDYEPQNTGSNATSLYSSTYITSTALF